MIQSSSADIGARLDRLPPSPMMWIWVGALSFGAFFEIYDISLTAFIGPTLVKAGLFKARGGLFGLNDQANLIAATFLGLWLGTLLFSALSDRLGRKPVFAFSLIWYAVATVIMGLQNTALGIDIFRAIAGLGIGVQLVSIDCYLAELLPKADRGRGFAVSTFIQFLAVPIGAALSIALVSHGVAGIAGWRCLAFIPGLAALAIFFVSRLLPESPRWLADHGQQQQAERLLSDMEARVRRQTGRDLPVAQHVAGIEEVPMEASFFQAPYRRTVVMLVVFHLFQTIGFFGFSNWIPSLIEARGVPLKSSLQYSLAIALAYPLSPLLFTAAADRVQRKWLIVIGALGAAVAGLLFADQRSPAGFIICGFLVTIFSGLMSFSYHTYQSELFPTRMRASAVGFVYSFSRLAAILSGYIIAALLQRGGPTTVFVFLAGCMLMVAIVIGGFGPRTNRKSLEEISASVGAGARP